MCTFLFVNKSEVPNIMKNLFAIVKTQFGKDIRVLRYNNGSSEFLNCKPCEFHKETSCLHQTSCTYTPEHNVRVERKHRQILNICDLFISDLEYQSLFGGECVLTVTHILNRTPSKVLNG